MRTFTDLQYITYMTKLRACNTILKSAILITNLYFSLTKIFYYPTAANTVQKTLQIYSDFCTVANLFAVPGQPADSKLSHSPSFIDKLLTTLSSWIINLLLDCFGV